jgi:hypothetical protein
MEHHLLTSNDINQGREDRLWNNYD